MDFRVEKYGGLRLDSILPGKVLAGSACVDDSARSAVSAASVVRACVETFLVDVDRYMSSDWQLSCLGIVLHRIVSVISPSSMSSLLDVLGILGFQGPRLFFPRLFVVLHPAIGGKSHLQDDLLPTWYLIRSPDFRHCIRK